MNVQTFKAPALVHCEGETGNLVRIEDYATVRKELRDFRSMVDTILHGEFRHKIGVVDAARAEYLLSRTESYGFNPPSH